MNLSIAWLASILSQPTMACSCSTGARFQIHPADTNAAPRNTREVLLGLGTGKFSINSVLTINGVESTAFTVKQEETTSQQLSVITFDELLPPWAEVVFWSADDGAEQFRFTTSDVIDEVDPTWNGGIDNVERKVDPMLSDCITGPYIGYLFKDFDDDITPPDDLLVEMVSHHGEKVWGAYGAVGMGLGDCVSVVPSLEYDYHQPFDATFYDEAGNASETHRVSGCACSSGGTPRGSLGFVGLLLAWLPVRRRRS